MKPTRDESSDYAALCEAAAELAQQIAPPGRTHETYDALIAFAGSIIDEARENAASPPQRIAAQRQR